MQNNKIFHNFKDYTREIVSDSATMLVTIFTIILTLLSLTVVFLPKPGTFRDLNNLKHSTGNLEQDVSDLYIKYQAIENTLKQTDLVDTGYKRSNLGIEELNTKIKNLQDTIDQSPNEAVTSILLKKDVENILAEVDDIKIRQQNLENKIDTTIYTFIGALSVSVFITVVVAPKHKKNRVN